MHSDPFGPLSYLSLDTIPQSKGCAALELRYGAAQKRRRGAKRRSSNTWIKSVVIVPLQKDRVEIRVGPSALAISQCYRRHEIPGARCRPRNTQYVSYHSYQAGSTIWEGNRQGKACFCIASPKQLPACIPVWILTTSQTASTLSKPTTNATKPTLSQSISVPAHPSSSTYQSVFNKTYVPLE